jgi:hypothetical protein
MTFPSGDRSVRTPLPLGPTGGGVDRYRATTTFHHPWWFWIAPERALVVVLGNREITLCAIEETFDIPIALGGGTRRSALVLERR